MDCRVDKYADNFWDRLIEEIKRKETIINLKDHKKTRLINIIREKKSIIKSQKEVIKMLEEDCIQYRSELDTLRQYIRECISHNLH